MSSLPPAPPPEPQTALTPTVPVPAPVVPPQRPAFAWSRAILLALAVLAGAGLLSSVLLWQRLSAIQEQLARQSADTGANAIEARALARQAQTLPATQPRASWYWRRACRKSPCSARSSKT